ncbi:hypothetical protein L1887_31660 [Cichorium endivia]|nr:hypothetical protein L1887_31660 [Cichorium endivia]
MEDELQKQESRRSSLKKLKTNDITRVRKRSERIMKKTTFNKFTNDPSNPIILDFDSDYSQPMIGLNLPEKTKKTEVDPNATKQATRIPEFHVNVKHERRLKNRSESHGIPVVV